MLYKTATKSLPPTTARNSPVSAISHWRVSLSQEDERGLPVDEEEDVSERRLGRVLDATTPMTTAVQPNNESDESTVSVTPSDSADKAISVKSTAVKGPKGGRKVKTTTKARRSGHNPRVSTRAATKNAGHPVTLLRGIEEIALPPKKPVTQQKTRHGQPVQVVKLLTGTLYLYRGNQRRVEFVRTK